MRLPGTQKIETKLVKAFDITDTDRRVITRGRRDVTSSVVGAGTGYVASGGDLFTDWKAGVAMVGTSALTTMVAKHQREKVNQTLYDEPPPEETPK